MRNGSPSSRKSRSPTMNLRGSRGSPGSVMDMFFLPLARLGCARRWPAGSPGRPPDRATSADPLAADAEPLLGAVAGRLLRPRLQARVEAGLAGVGLADRVREDAVGVDLERQVGPAGQDLGGR